MTQQEIIENLKTKFGVETKNAYPKKTYLRDGFPFIGVFSSELKEDFYFYVEYRNEYYKLPYRENYKEYYIPEIFDGKTKYQIDMSDCILLKEPEEYRELEDASFMGETTLRDVASIILNKPVSNKTWLNEIINLKQ